MMKDSEFTAAWEESQEEFSIACETVYVHAIEGTSPDGAVLIPKFDTPLEKISGFDAKEE